jgi:hypothetical protein
LPLLSPQALQRRRVLAAASAEARLFWVTCRAGRLYNAEHMPALLLAFQQEDPELAIFLKDDFTWMDHLGFYIQHSATYTRDESYSELTIFRRRAGAPIQYIKAPPGELPAAWAIRLFGVILEWSRFCASPSTSSFSH